MGTARWELGLAGQSPWKISGYIEAAALPLTDVRPQPAALIGQPEKTWWGMASVLIWPRCVLFSENIRAPFDARCTC
jgi:hypothetical protein